MSDEPLFRPEAMAHQRDSAFGRVLLRQPFSLNLIIGLAVVLTGLLFLVLVWGNYTEKQTVSGVLVPNKGVARLYAPNAAVVQSVLVHEGSHVRSGDPLWSGRQEHHAQGGVGVEEALVKHWQDISHNLNEKIAQEDSLFALQRTQNEQRVHALAQEVRHLQAQASTQAERLRLVANKMERLRGLKEKGAIAQQTWDDAQEQALSVQQQHDELIRQAQSKQAQREEILLEAQRLPLAHEAQLADLRNQQAELQQKRYDLEGRYAFEVRSPIEGVVTAVQITPGESVPSNHLAMIVVPEAYEVSAEVFLPTRAAAFVQEGQEVVVRYAAFPYERYGLYSGRVLEVSKTMLMPNDLPVVTSLNEPVYRVKIGLDEQVVRVAGQTFPLQAGLQLEADILTDRKTLLQWILAPIYRFKGRL